MKLNTFWYSRNLVLIHCDSDNEILVYLCAHYFNSLGSFSFVRYYPLESLRFLYFYEMNIILSG